LALETLLPNERGWITFAEASGLFSTERTEYAFGELDQSGREKIEAQHQSIINLMPVEGRVYFVRSPTAANVRFTPKNGRR